MVQLIIIFINIKYQIKLRHIGLHTTKIALQLRMASAILNPYLQYGPKTQRNGMWDF